MSTRRDGSPIRSRAFAKVNQDAFGCSQARNKGRAICSNMTTIKRVDLESRVLEALEHHLMDPGLVEEFCREYAAERNRLQAASLAGRSALERDLARVKSDHGKLVDAIVAMGAGLKMPITAEGIEDEAILDSLRSISGLKGQGYHYGRPETAAAVIDRLRDHGLLSDRNTESGSAPRRAIGQV